MSDMNEMLGKVTEFLKSEAKTHTIIGEEFKLGEFTCVPVMSVGMGFAGGGGEGKGPMPGSAKGSNMGEGSGTGGGAGMGMGPVGFLVTRGADINFISTRSSKGLSAAFEKVPDLIDKYLEKKV